jgi:hypothetical protein
MECMATMPLLSTLTSRDALGLDQIQSTPKSVHPTPEYALPMLCKL